MTAQDRKPPPDSRQGRQNTPQGEWPNEGEGSKSADRRYRQATEAFVKSGRAKRQAEKAAEALDGGERDELIDAEAKGRGRAR